MTEAERILDQYERVMNGDAWHGDPVWKTIDGISARQACNRTQADTHTIWELVSHMMFWEGEVIRRLNSLPEQFTDEMNFPAMPHATEQNWTATLQQFRRSNAEFRQCLLRLDRGRLDQTAPGRDRSIYAEVHGVIQHHLYHAGQIAILKKFVEQE